MRPTREQIDMAAYHRWQRRGGAHGHDQDDWLSAEKDLTFALTYRYLARYKLADGSNGTATIQLGKGETAGLRLPVLRAGRAVGRVPLTAAGAARPLQTPSLLAWDECEECRRTREEYHAGPFEAFARPIFEGPTASTPSEIPVAALKVLVRLALSILPASELTHFDDTIEWVTNPDHDQDSRTLSGLGCHLYVTPAPVPAPFLALAKRADDDAPFPYMLVFLGGSRTVLQTHLPLCPRDEDLQDTGIRGPELSMSLGNGPELRSSACTFLPVAVAQPLRTPAETVQIFRRRAAGV